MEFFRRWLHIRKMKQKNDPFRLAWEAHEWRELSFLLLQELMRFGVGENKKNVDQIVEQFRKRKREIEK